MSLAATRRRRRISQARFVVLYMGEVYLPEESWVSVIDKEVYEGLQTVKVHVEIDQYIAFVKGGSEALDVFL